MLRPRVIPVLLIHGESLVKTTKFGDFVYVGDPCNTLKIFNELEVDELFVLDISATKNHAMPNLKLLSDISNECFMPLGYGGGVKSIEQAKTIFDVGFEKIVINTQAINNPSLITDIANYYGSQSIIVSIDVKTSMFGSNEVMSYSGTMRTGLDPIAWAKEVQNRGAGEILITSINREGTWCGFDLELIKSVSDSVSIPVVAHGGAGSLEDISLAINTANASAVALGSMVVFQKKGFGVLVHFPAPDMLASILSR